MKTIEGLTARIEKTASQKRDVIQKLEHLEKRFEIHNDRVEAGVEIFIVAFELSPNKQYVNAMIIDSISNLIIKELTL